jgi:hypothetical protein
MSAGLVAALDVGLRWLDVLVGLDIADEEDCPRSRSSSDR